MKLVLWALLAMPAAGAATAKDHADPGGLAALSAEFWSELAELERIILSMRALRDAVPAAEPLDPLLAEHKRLTAEFKERLERAKDRRHRFRALARGLQGALAAPARAAKRGDGFQTDPAYAALYAQEGDINRMRSHKEDLGDRFEAEGMAFDAALEARRAARAERLWLGAAAAAVLAAFLAAWLKLR